MDMLQNRALGGDFVDVGIDAVVAKIGKAKLFTNYDTIRGLNIYFALGGSSSAR